MSSESDEKFRVIADIGRDGEPEPTALVVEGARYEVVGISDRWDDEKATYFKLLASDGRMYLVRYDLEAGTWSLVREWMLDA